MKSSLGAGTCFKIRLPAGVESGETETGAKPADGGLAVDRRAETRVLVVDDDELTLEAHLTVLQDDGYTVVAAGGGREAVQQFENAPFDVVVTDVGMPGMSGRDVAKRVKALRPQVKVILLSGWGIQENLKEAREAGIDRVLSRPYPLAALLTAIKEVLSGAAVQVTTESGAAPPSREMSRT